jgi:hypothetical protein
VLAQRLHDEGLLYAVNRLVLHAVGLALGVRARAVDDSHEVTGLCLFATDDPEGIRYDDPEGTVRRALAKLRDAGHKDLACRLADIALGIPEYPHPDGDVMVLGPEVIASEDGAVIAWKGEHYERIDGEVLEPQTHDPEDNDA